MPALTARQAQILEFIRRSLEDTGFPPTQAEIARALGFRSITAAREHLLALARKGVLEIREGASRGLRLKQAPGIALIGRVAAGSPILAEAHVEKRFQLDPALFRPHADFLLKVRGMSMRNAGILDGDLLAVHSAAEARSGQIVVARIADEVTVKRLRRRGHAVELLAENPEFKPIVLDLRRDALTIEGIAVGVIRNGKIG